MLCTLSVIRFMSLIVSVLRILYPRDRWINTIVVSLETLSWIPSISTFPSFIGNSSYFTPNSFNDPWLSDSYPMTVCIVSYGAPVIDTSLSPGRSIPSRTVANACVPDTNWVRTNARSAPNVLAYSSSSLERPISSYAYPFDIVKCDAASLTSLIASSTLSVFFSAILSTRLNAADSSSITWALSAISFSENAKFNSPSYEHID